MNEEKLLNFNIPFMPHPSKGEEGADFRSLIIESLYPPTGILVKFFKQG